MKKLLAFVVAGMFSLSAAAYACDGAKMTKTQTQKTDSAKVAKKETKTPAKTTTKKS
jgi:hypothetical protein